MSLPFAEALALQDDSTFLDAQRAPTPPSKERTNHIHQTNPIKAQHHNALERIKAIDRFRNSNHKMSKDSSPAAPSTSYEAFGCPTPYAEPLWYSRNVTPHYTASHRKLRAAVRKYVDLEILPHAFEWESAAEVPDSARDPISLFKSSSLHSNKKATIGLQTTC